MYALLALLKISSSQSGLKRLFFLADHKVLAISHLDIGVQVRVRVEKRATMLIRPFTLSAFGQFSKRLHQL